MKQLTSTRGARLWTLDKGVTAFGDICRCLSFSDSCLFSRALVSVPPPRGCQELQRIQQTDSGWVRLPELWATRFQSRSSQSFPSLLDTQRTQFFLFSLTGTSQSRPIRALISPPHWWGSTALIYTLSFSTVSLLPGSSSDPHANILMEPTSQPALFFSSFQRSLWIRTFFKSQMYTNVCFFSVTSY